MSFHFLLHLLLICTIQKVLSVLSDKVGCCRHIAADHIGALTVSAASLPCHCACCQQLLSKAFLVLCSLDGMCFMLM